MSDALLRSLITLAILSGLAGVLIWLLPTDALALPTFQSPLTHTPTRPVTVAPSATALVTVTASSTATVAAVTPPPPMDSAAA
ncbi:MAG: hypothetical protein ACP5UQ_11495, partial [Anaerolineae bacterium]